MPEKYSFFNAVDNDRVYLAEDFAEYFASFIGTGVYANPTNNLQVLSDTGMQITVNAGKAWINGYFYQNTAELSLTLANASGTLNRIDSIVIQCDFTEREMRATVKQGTPSNAPVAPSLVRTQDMYEIQLATVYIKAGAASILQQDITDTRMNNSVCGIVAGVVDQIDTEGLFTQYDDEWNYWFNNVKGTLSGDVAGNLQSQITDLQSSKATTTTYTATISTTWTGEQAPYTQNISVSGILSTDNPLVDIILNNDNEIAKSEIENYGKISRIQTTNGSITVTCLEDKPEVEMNIQLKVVR